MRSFTRASFVVVFASSLTAVACVPAARPAPWAPAPPPPIVGVPPAQLPIFTQDGWMGLEDYVARVCTAENGTAPFEALKAQAVAARTYVLRSMRDERGLGTADKPIGSSQAFQVYAPVANDGCSQATATTLGIVLRHRGALTIANYVAGARLREDGGFQDDPTRTEKWVTYNRGKIGPFVQPTPLSRVDRPDNRGCMSQNGARWMARHGWSFVAILRYYYGEDIEIGP